VDESKGPAEAKYQVLIFDDDVALGEMLREYLLISVGCSVTLVHTPLDFWPALRAGSFDVLFLDYQLQGSPHGLTGLDVLEQMQKEGCALPTVMMTGQGSEKIAARAIQCGAIDYLVKGDLSFNLQALPTLIQKAVQLRKLQIAVRQSEEKIHYQAMLLENVRDAVVVWDLNGKLTYWNITAEQLYGRSAAEMIGRSAVQYYFTLFTPQLEPVEGVPGPKMQAERVFHSSSTGRIWVSSHVSPLFDTAQTLTGYMDVTRDITLSKLEQEELERSQHLIQRILEASPNIVYTLNLRTNQINYISPKIEPVLGLHVADILHARNPFFFSMVEPKDLPVLVRHYNNLENLPEKEISEIEYRVKLDHSEWRWLKNRETSFSRDEHGRLVEIIGVCEDITLRKRMEEKLLLRLNSEKLLSSLSNLFITLPQANPNPNLSEAIKSVAEFIGAESGLLFLTVDHMLRATIPYQSPGRTTGYTLPAGSHPLPSDIDYKREKFPWLDAELHRQALLLIPSVEKLPPAALEECKPFLTPGLRSAVLVPLIYGDELFGVLVLGMRAVELHWENDYEYLLRTFGQTLLKALIQSRIGLELQKSESRYRAIVEEHQTEMICRFYPDGKLTFVNEAYCRYYNCERSSLLGTSYFDLIQAEDQPQVKSLLQGLTCDDPVAISTHRVNLEGDYLRWQEWVIRGISAQTKCFSEFQAVGRDITERKMMEEQIQSAQMRLAQATRLASIGQLAASVAHQISNPLTTIIADGQMLLHSLNQDEPEHESAEAIVQAGWRAQRVIDELMKFSQPSNDNQELVYINETIEKALLLSTAHLHTAGTVLDLDLPEMSPELQGNGRQLTDLWVNLLLAPLTVEECGVPQVVRIQVHETADGMITARIINVGVLISAEQLETIFEPQLIPAGGKGTGIELSICREIVRQHNGEIFVSCDDQSTTFEILLPKGDKA
jgi:PAS domain S-box-containing protein